MDDSQKKYSEKTAEHLIKRFERRNMEGSYVETAEQALEKVLSMIPDNSTVFRCGSVSTTAMGLWDKLAKTEGVEVIDPYEPGIEPAESLARRKTGLTADVMVASANAVTMDGQLVNLDGMGNRVAAITFGPTKVILVVGLNKVVSDLHSAWKRVKHLAAPVNAMRLNLKTPCNETGQCADCNSPSRICRIWQVVEGHMIKGRIHIVLVGEDMGY